jgi:type IV secretory pathway VirB3-like protein
MNLCGRMRKFAALMRPQRIEGVNMLWTIFVILLVLWLFGFSFHIAGSLIHILLVVALIVLIFNLISGRR